MQIRKHKFTTQAIQEQTMEMTELILMCVYTHMPVEQIGQLSDFEVIAFLAVICIFILVKLMIQLDFKGNFITLGLHLKL